MRHSFTFNDNAIVYAYTIQTEFNSGSDDEPKIEAFTRCGGCMCAEDREKILEQERKNVLSTTTIEIPKNEYDTWVQNSQKNNLTNCER
jgi:hypothetical protein